MQPAKITPKDFFLWVGAMAALYTSVFAFVSLIFGYLDYVFPDPLAYYAYYSGDPYSSGLSTQMAMIIVLLPIFFALITFIRRSIAADPTRRDVWIRRWALYLTIFIAGATVAVDLVTLVIYFLNGDVTVRFLLKVATILLVALGGFLHFLADLRDFWDAQPRQRAWVAWGVGAVALAAIITGFFIVGTPWEARLYRYDNEKVGNLQAIQSQIIYHWQSKRALPQQLSELNDSISGFMVPTDPQTGDSYEYRVTGGFSFSLCATFNAQTQGNAYRTDDLSRPVGPSGKGAAPDNWYHEAGNYCYERTIDPDLYPPMTRPAGEPVPR